MIVQVNMGVGTNEFELDSLQELADEIVAECEDIWGEMPRWWAEQERLGGAVEAVADQYVVDGQCTAATMPAVMELVKAGMEGFDPGEPWWSPYLETTVAEK